MFKQYLLKCYHFPLIFLYFSPFQIFTANSDASTPVEILFPEPVYARIVRITCMTSHNAVKMRFEILGCRNDDS